MPDGEVGESSCNQSSLTFIQGASMQVFLNHVSNRIGAGVGHRLTLDANIFTSLKPRPPVEDLAVQHGDGIAQPGVSDGLLQVLKGLAFQAREEISQRMGLHGDDFSCSELMHLSSDKRLW